MSKIHHCLLKSHCLCTAGLHSDQKMVIAFKILSSSTVAILTRIRTYAMWYRKYSSYVCNYTNYHMHIWFCEPIILLSVHLAIRALVFLKTIFARGMFLLLSSRSTLWASGCFNRLGRGHKQRRHLTCLNLWSLFLLIHIFTGQQHGKRFLPWMATSAVTIFHANYGELYPIVKLFMYGYSRCIQNYEFVFVFCFFLVSGCCFS